MAELLSEQSPAPLYRIGIRDRFGESGSPAELLDYFGLSAPTMLEGALEFIQRVPQYKPGY